MGLIEQASSGSPSTLCASNWRSAPLSLLSRNIVVPSTTGPPQGAAKSMLCTRSAPGPYESSSALTMGRNWNTQYTRGPLSTLRRSLPFGFLRLALFGHVIAPDVIQPSSENTANRQRGPYDLTLSAGLVNELSVYATLPSTWVGRWIAF